MAGGLGGSGGRMGAAAGLTFGASTGAADEYRP